MMWYGARKTKKVFYRPYKKYVEVEAEPFDIITASGRFDQDKTIDILINKCGEVYTLKEYWEKLESDPDYTSEEVEEKKEEILESGSDGWGAFLLNCDGELYVLDYIL